MAVKVITEVGDEIPLEGDLVNGGPAADAFVAEQRATLGLPETPMKAADAVAFKIERETRRLQDKQFADDLVENAAKPPLVMPPGHDMEL